MAQAVLEAEALVGQSRNMVHGERNRGGLVPWRVFNLAPDRRGGYTPYGRRVRLAVSAVNVTLVNIPRLQGYDATGVATLVSSVSAPGNLEVFRGSVRYPQTVASYAQPWLAVHLDAAGAYIDRSAYLVLNRDNHLVEPLETRVAPVLNVGAPQTATQLDAGQQFRGVAYGNGFFIAVTSEGSIYRSDDDGVTWTIIETVPGAEFQHIRYGNGRFVAITFDAVAHYSTDDGDTWTSSVVAASWDTRHISWGGGDVWFVSGQGANSARGIFRSPDGGVTWALVDDLYSAIGSRTWNVRNIAADTANAIYAGAAWDATPNQGPTLEVPWTRSEIFIDSEDGGTSFNFASATGGTADVKSFLRDEGWSYTEHVRDQFWSINYDLGRIANSREGATRPDEWWLSGEVDGAPYRIVYNRVRNQAVIVGYASFIVVGGGTPRIWQGTSPASMVRQEELEQAITDAGGGGVTDVAFNDAGDAVYVCRNGVVLSTGAGAGLQEGSYNLYFVTYFNTRAGRFICGFDRQTVSFSSAFNNSIDITAQTKENIISSNAWLAASPNANAIVDDLRLDVYIQYQPTGTGIDEDSLTFSETLAQNTIRYAFTVPFPDAGADPLNDIVLPKRIGDLPIGRQIVSRGLPTTTVFQEGRAEGGGPVLSRTAIHNGRMWGLASQDEDRWPSDDGISLEIANQFNRFVLCYTEVGWANLMSDQSYIPIQPSQSANFTGMVSTPSGLLVIFDNEIFLVTGDPAFGNVTVELYLDMAGGDVGSVPASIGGISFTVWDGKVWAIQAGEASDISGEQWLEEDRFVRVAAEAQTRSILCLTESGQVLRYIVDDQFWMTDPVNRDAFAIAEILPNCIDPDGDDSRFVTSAGEVWVTRGDGTPDAPHLVYREMDYGFPERRTALHLVKATLEGAVAGLNYDRSDGAFSGAALPALFYASGREDNGMSAASVSPLATGGIIPVCPAIGLRSTATLSWRMPVRRTRYFTMDARLELRGMAYNDVLKLPLRFFHSAGGETR